MEERLHLILQAQAGDKQIRDALIEENLGLVHHIVKRFANRGYDMEELFQIGCIGLIKAIDHFGIEYDVQFSTYAVPLIMGEIGRFIRDNGMIKVSRNLKENLWKIKAVQNEIQKHTGRDATIDEIALKTGLDQESILLAMESEYEVDSLSRTVYQKDGNEITLGDRIADDKDEENEIMQRVFLKQLLACLSEQERGLIILRYFENKTQMQTAQILGITQVQVSRQEKKILTKLRKLNATRDNMI